MDERQKDARDLRVLELYSQALGPSEIARAMRITKNTVIGVLKRDRDAFPGEPILRRVPEDVQ